MKKYAVTESVFFHFYSPFGKCREVVRETKDFVILRRNGSDTTDRISKTKVFGYCENDISEQLIYANKKIIDGYDAHLKFAKSIIEEVKEKYLKQEDK